MKIETESYTKITERSLREVVGLLVFSELLIARFFSTPNLVSFPVRFKIVSGWNAFPSPKSTSIFVGGLLGSWRKADRWRLASGGFEESSKLVLWRLRGLRRELAVLAVDSGANILVLQPEHQSIKNDGWWQQTHEGLGNSRRRRGRAPSINATQTVEGIR